MDVRLYYLSLLHSSAVKGICTVPAHKTLGKELEEWVLFRKYHNAGEDIETLAARLGLPRDEVASFINGWLGDRFLTIRKRLRVHDACELLTSRRDLSLAEIARKVGFQDKTDFRRAFTQEKGMTPRMWRECGGNRIRYRIIKLREAGRNRCP
ncbi:MAG: AraC family transcriptional regulator [Bacteroidales bacterium]|nr:AraC family transcriptional regulator [Bacteroidales bacterium]